MKINLMSNDTYSESQLTGLVILRILIGWHFLYEGISKIINPYWSSAAYLLDSKWILSSLAKTIVANSLISKKLLNAIFSNEVFKIIRTTKIIL